MSTITTRESNLPALVTTPALEIDATDVALSKVYIAHFQSKLVQAEDSELKAGMIFAATGEDDPEPAILWDPKAKEPNPGVLFHVLGLRKGKSVTVDGELQTFAFNDPQAPEDAWVTYGYTIVLPEHDLTEPYRMLFTRTKGPAAKQINKVLKKNEGRGPAWASAFRMTTAFRENAKGKWYVPMIQIVEANPEHVAAAETLAGMVADSSPFTPPASSRAAADEPAI